MTNVIVAFSKPEDAKCIKNILMRNGFQVIGVCTSGAQTLSCVEGISTGIVVSGYRFADMMATGLYEFLPSGLDMLLISSLNRLSDKIPENIVCLPMPLKVHELISTMEMMEQAQARRRRKQKLKPKERNEEEQILIDRAKVLLMERNHMTETEAHRYIQKCSMDSGTNMVETAQMVVSLIER